QPGPSCAESSRSSLRFLCAKSSKASGGCWSPESCRSCSARSSSPARAPDCSPCCGSSASTPYSTASCSVFAPSGRATSARTSRPASDADPSGNVIDLGSSQGPAQIDQDLVERIHANESDPRVLEVEDDVRRDGDGGGDADEI